MSKKVLTLICERSCDLSGLVNEKDQLKEVSSTSVIKFPCSGMIQPLMIEAALKNGFEGVVVTGCQIGDCYYREGNRMIRERLLGDRPPTLKKAVDRRRVLGLWLSKVQPQRLIGAIKEFQVKLESIPPEPAAEAKK